MNLNPCKVWEAERGREGGQEGYLLPPHQRSEGSEPLVDTVQEDVELVHTSGQVDSFAVSLTAAFTATVVTYSMCTMPKISVYHLSMHTVN